MKKSLLIFVLFALSGAPFLTELHAETTVKTRKIQTVEVDWLEGDTLKGDLNPAEQEEALKRIKKHPYWKMLPPMCSVPLKKIGKGTIMAKI